LIHGDIGDFNRYDKLFFINKKKRRYDILRIYQYFAIVDIFNQNLSFEFL